MDTPDCDSDTTAIECGDDYVNKAAGEQCESNADCSPHFFCVACTCIIYI